MCSCVCDTEASRNINQDNLDIGEQLVAGTRPGYTYLRINHLLEFKRNALVSESLVVSALEKSSCVILFTTPLTRTKGKLIFSSRDIFADPSKTQYHNIVSIYYQPPHNCSACGHPRNVSVLLAAVAAVERAMCWLLT